MSEQLEVKVSDDVEPWRAAYAERARALVKEGLEKGSHLSQIAADGRLLVIEYFADDLQQAREFLKFLEILRMSVQARNNAEPVFQKRSFFRGSRLTEHGEALSQLDSQISEAEGAVSNLDFAYRARERQRRRGRTDS